MKPFIITPSANAPVLDFDTTPADGVMLEVRALSVSYHVDRKQIDAVSDISLNLMRGQTTALLGESGSGKSTIVSSIVGTLPTSSRTQGSVQFGPRDLLALSERQWRPLRGVDIGYVPQNSARSLDPLLRIEQHLDEALTVHGVRAPWAHRRERILRQLERVGFGDPQAVARRYPHELSGGMQQRVLIAIALTWTPRILIADEPTSALDVTVQKSVLDLIDRRKREDDMAVLLVTHDIGVAASRSQHVVVLREGRIVESGPTDRVLNQPQHAYTQQLLRDVPGARPRWRGARHRGSAAPAIELKRVCLDYPSGPGQVQRAVNDVSISVAHGSTLAIVGESGSGKTSTARIIARFLAPTAGEVIVCDAAGKVLDTQGEQHYRRRVQYVYQNPYLSLNPKHTLATVLTEPLRAFGVVPAKNRAARVLALLDMVALPRSFLTRRPRQLSGGQLQRLAIARALAPAPEILVLDEPVSALDVTVQAQILTLLDRLQAELNLTYVFISHDLGVVRQISDQVVVMRSGEIVERGETDQVLQRPSHPYTRQLVQAVPRPARAISGASIPQTGDALVEPRKPRYGS